ncbi:phage shock protein A (PspA) family protein [Amphibacillus marinus]|uniref:Phage shock protein A (PspA) family protein n=1 Tax=Amphibacillus marinus TaxID=872970 RepID=A0A1H8PPR3_9BACI|nr:PspA/IM30 family protein [Amphibacillus marinus]SEO43992.1 phage shock protein A (PspA) family protein [Amphibacillus marinus]
MSILQRFKSIISSNVNAALDRAEDPEKVIDQQLRNMLNDLAEVRKNTMSVMAEESKIKRQLDENHGEVNKYAELAKKALTAGNESDARVFLAKKQELEDVGVGLANTFALAHENASKMRHMHDKLANDIEALKARRAAIKAQLSIANSTEKLNSLTTSAGDSGSAGAIKKMEERATQRLDEANAMASLNEEPVDEAGKLEEKYSSGLQGGAVDDELQRMKDELGI